VDSLVSGRRERVPAGADFHCLDVGTPALEQVFAGGRPFDVVSHHAALKDVRRSLIDPRPDAEANIVGTLNVLRLAAAHGSGRFVFPSSAAIYGDPTIFPTPESANIAPISPYGISKAAAELYCTFYARTLGLPGIALRYSTVYGPAASEASEAGVITMFTRRLLTGSIPVIYGDGGQSRDLLYVDDVVRANLLAIERAPHPWAVYNVCTGVETTINELYRRLAASVGTDSPPQYAPAKPGEVRRNIQDATRLRGETGWAPRVGLDEGLAQVVAAFRAERSAVAAPG
jgi:UDP-glucose 4-epimerase